MSDDDVDNMDFELPYTPTTATPYTPTTNMVPTEFQNHSNIDISKWKCIYPVYVDEQATRKRKVPKESAIINPSLVALAQSCQRLGIPVFIEQKDHSTQTHKGRLRVWSESSKKQLLKRIVQEYKNCSYFIIF